MEFHVAIVCEKNTSGAWSMSIYKHDVRSGVALKTLTFALPDGWTPAAFNAGYFRLGYSSDAGNDDANATYRELRVWNRALSAAELAESVRLGPDVLPVIGESGAGVADLPTGTEVVVSNGAALALCGANQAVGEVSGLGMIIGPGSLSATEFIQPGDTTGALTLSCGVTLSGTVKLSFVGDKAANFLDFAPGATYDVSGLVLEVEDLDSIPDSVVIGHSTGAVLSGAIDVSRIPGKKVVVKSNGDIVLKGCGLMLILR